MSTMQKFGVPLGGGAGRGNILQPKLKFRWRARFVNFGPIAGGLDLSRNIVSISKPSISHDQAEIHAYHSIGYIAGKPEWDDLSITVRDDVSNTVSRLVGHQLQKQQNHFEQTGFLAGVNYTFTTILEIMDGGNDGVLETWTYEACWLKSVDYGDLDYTDTSGFSTIDMSIRFSNVTQSDGLMPTASGSGGRIGGGLGIIDGVTIG